jgi:hypothetical protein
MPEVAGGGRGSCSEKVSHYERTIKFKKLANHHFAQF